LGEVSVETKSGKGRKKSGTDYSCSEFHAGFDGAKTGFLSLTVWEIIVIENGKKSGLILKYASWRGNPQTVELYKPRHPMS
jgi:hypothetical protein